LLIVDPSGHCWGFAGFLRNTFYSTTCNNLDMAVSIVQHPDASVGQKVAAGAYIAGEAVAHTVAVGGSVVAGVGCLTGAGTAICAGAGTAVTATSADGDPTNEAAAVANGVSNVVQAVSSDGDPFNEAQTALSITNKLQGYLLNLSHSEGGSKARWFKEALGFTQENQTDLAKQIIFNESTAIQTAITEYGTKYNQVITITGANGKVIDVTFGWIRNNDGIIRLVTAIPTKQ
ncbi:MAG: hypothetical protein KF770_28065, partial [Anaerolineae bacterium]|nr:hypothetical protein [Anaerolineae bacterium]